MANVWRSQLSSRCADWMSQLPPQLLDVPLWDLAIPGIAHIMIHHKPVYLLVMVLNMKLFFFSGSHDSMTYCLDQHSPVLRSEPRILTVLDRIAPCVIRPCIKKWATTQVKKKSVCALRKRDQTVLCLLVPSCHQGYIYQ